MHAVHPRMRGENESEDLVINWDAGSSPHARGKRLCTPWRHTPLSVHPRMRGENALPA